MSAAASAAAASAALGKIPLAPVSREKMEAIQQILKQNNMEMDWTEDKEPVKKNSYSHKGTVYLVDEKMGARINISISFRGFFIQGVKTHGCPDDMLKLNKWLERMRTPRCYKGCTKKCVHYAPDDVFDDFNILVPYNFVIGQNPCHSIINRAVFTVLSRWKHCPFTSRRHAFDRGNANNNSRLPDKPTPYHQLFDLQICHMLIAVDLSVLIQLILGLRGRIASAAGRKITTCIDFVERMYSDMLETVMKNMETKFFSKYKDLPDITALWLQEPEVALNSLMHILLSMSDGFGRIFSPQKPLSLDTEMLVVFPLKHPLTSHKRSQLMRRDSHVIFPSLITGEYGEPVHKTVRTARRGLVCNHAIVKRYLLNVVRCRTPTAMTNLIAEAESHGRLEILAADPDALLVPASGSFGTDVGWEIEENDILKRIVAIWEYAATDKALPIAIKEQMEDDFDCYQEDLKSMSFEDMEVWLLFHTVFAFSMGQSPIVDKEVGVRGACECRPDVMFSCVDVVFHLKAVIECFESGVNAVYQSRTQKIMQTYVAPKKKLTPPPPAFFVSSTPRYDDEDTPNRHHDKVRLNWDSEDKWRAKREPLPLPLPVPAPTTPLSETCGTETDDNILDLPTMEEFNRGRITPPGEMKRLPALQCTGYYSLATPAPSIEWPPRRTLRNPSAADSEEIKELNKWKAIFLDMHKHDNCGDTGAKEIGNAFALPDCCSYYNRRLF